MVVLLPDYNTRKINFIFADNVLMFLVYVYVIRNQWSSTCNKKKIGPEWLDELGSWITYQLIQAYHQYGVGSHPAL